MATTLVNTYKRYKAGQEKLVKWLADAADQCNIHLPQKRSRFSAADLLTLAQRVVASTNPKIAVPVEIVDVANDAVLGRQSCAEWYTLLAADQPTSSVTAQSNARHQHFLRILKQILGILRKAHRTSLPKREKKLAELASDVDDLANLYTHLELEEPEWAAGNDLPASPPAEGPSASTTTQANGSGTDYFLDNEEEEKLFALWCLFKDSHDVRIYVRDIWKRYNEGDLSFFATSRMTDIAIDIICQTADEFAGQHPELRTFDRIVAHLGAESYMVEARRNQLRTETGQDFTAHGSDAVRRSDLLCMPGWCALTDYRAVASFLWQNGDTEGRRFNLFFPCHPFSKALLAIAADVKSLCPIFTVIPAPGSAQEQEYQNLMMALDTFTRRLIPLTIMSRYESRSGINIGLVSATQIYMDVYDMLDGDLSRGHSEVAATLGHVQSIAHQFCGYATSATVYTNYHIDMKPTQSLVQDLGNLAKPGQWKDGCEGWMFQLPGKPDASFIPLSLLTTLPLLAAHQVWNPLFAMNYLGNMLLNIMEIGLATGFLYRAAQVSGGLKSAWTDLEFLIERLNDRSTFMRPSENNLLSTIKAYRLSLGMPLAEVRKREWKSLPNPDIIKKQANKAKFLSHYMQMVSSGENSFKSGHRAQAGPPETTAMQQYYEWLRLHVSECGGIRDHAIAAQWAQTKRLSPVQLLTVLLESFVADEVYFNFDCINFATDCLEVLEAAADALHSRRMGSDWRDQGKRLYPMYAVVDEIVAEALHETASRTARGWKGQLLLRKVAQIIETKIQKTGDAHTKRSHGISSGHLPDAQKPAMKYPNTADRQGAIAQPTYIAYHEQVVEEVFAEGDVRSEEKAAICAEAVAEFNKKRAAGLGEVEAIDEVKQLATKALRDKLMLRSAEIDVIDGQVIVTTRQLTEEEKVQEVDAQMTPESLGILLKNGSLVR